MKWGEAQSAIQLAAAFGGLYFTFREISNPTLTQEASRLAMLSQFISSLPDSAHKAHCLAGLTGLHISMQHEVEQFKAKDREIGVMCLWSSISMLCCLFLSSILYEHQIYLSFFVIIFTAGFFPIALAVVENVKISRRIKKVITPARQQLEVAAASRQP